MEFLCGSLEQPQLNITVICQQIHRKRWVPSTPHPKSKSRKTGVGVAGHSLGTQGGWAHRSAHYQDRFTELYVSTHKSPSSRVQRFTPVAPATEKATAGFL